MARQDGRLEPGQKLDGAISARAWNRMMDAADFAMGDRLSLTAGPQQYSSAPYTWVYGYNATGHDLSRWSVAQVEDMYVPPNENSNSGYGTFPNQSQFESMPVIGLTSATSAFTTAEKTGAWCIPIEPIKQFTIGRVAIAGAVQAKINVTNAFFRFVDPRNGALETAEQGYARILWKEPGEGGSRWALLHLGCSEDHLLFAPFPGVWNFGEQKTLTLTQENLTGEFTETVKVINGLMNVEAGTNGGTCILYRRAWDYQNAVLVDFVMSTLKGYDASNPVLKRHGGAVQWKSPSLQVTKDNDGKVTDVTLQWN